MTIKDNPIDTIIDDKLNLDQFTGTEHYYKHFTGIKYTDGIKYLADKTSCYWFIDIIASYQTDKRVNSCSFQIWKLEANVDRLVHRITEVCEKCGEEEVSEAVYRYIGVVTMREDTDKKPIITQELGYTDFPLKEIEVYCIDGVILLKSEY